MTHIFIIADSPIVQVGLEAIATDSDLTVVGRANRVLGWQQAEATAVEVVLVSAELSEESLSLFAPLLDSEQLVPAIVWLVDPQQDIWIAEALRQGILGILPNDATANEIVAAIEAVTVGLIVLHPEITSLLTQSSPRSLLAPVDQVLTQREIEVLQMLAEGMANKTIARHLHISEHTVKFHVSSIFAKLDVSSRTEAVTIGIRQGLILL